MSSRQTLSYLRRLLEERGLDPKSKLGQNFLIDLNLVDFIIRHADLHSDDLALEVGSGTGSLTTRLVEQAGAVVSIEIDQGFAELARETVEPQEKVILLHGDVLKNKNELNPDLLRAIAQLQERTGTRRIKLIANLPYAVATPVVSNLLLTDLPIERMVVMVQWEIAEKLTAEVGSSEYGGLTVLVQSLAEVHLLRRLSPKVFWPRPKVDSAIVLIQPDPIRRAKVGDVVRFRAFLRDLYVHRRKNLRGALKGMPGGAWSKQEIDEKLAKLDLPGTARADDLDLEQHLRLCQAFSSEGMRDEG